MVNFILLLGILAGLIVAYHYLGGEIRLRGKTQRQGDPFQGRYEPRQGHSGQPVDKGGMTRCHNCATFFPMGRVIHEIVQGHVLEFCSENCKRQFHSTGLS